MIRRIALSVLLLLVCVAVPASAVAGDRPKHGGGSSGAGGNSGGGGKNGGRQWVPEFDPATVGAVAVVLAGGGLILARRRKP
jgi:hypothetical protein